MTYGIGSIAADQEPYFEAEKRRSKWLNTKRCKDIVSYVNDFIVSAGIDLGLIKFTPWNTKEAKIEIYSLDLKSKAVELSGLLKKEFRYKCDVFLLTKREGLTWFSKVKETEKISITVECEECRGTGLVAHDFHFATPCKKCNGEGSMLLSITPFQGRKEIDNTNNEIEAVVFKLYPYEQFPTLRYGKVPNYVSPTDIIRSNYKVAFPPISLKEYYKNLKE